jgi:tRNA pseudouridine55 synthase
VEELKAMTLEEIAARLPHPRTMLPEMPAVIVDEATAGRLRNGMQVNVQELSAAPLVKIFSGPRELLCIARRVAGTLVQPMVVIG